MIHKACMPVYMNSGKIVADGTGRDGTGGKIEGSTRGPRGPKNHVGLEHLVCINNGPSFTLVFSVGPLFKYIPIYVVVQCNIQLVFTDIRFIL